MACVAKLHLLVHHIGLPGLLELAEPMLISISLTPTSSFGLTLLLPPLFLTPAPLPSSPSSPLSPNSPYSTHVPSLLLVPYSSCSNSLVFALTSCFSPMPVLLPATLAIANAARSGVMRYPVFTSVDANCASCQTTYMVTAQPKWMKTKMADIMVEKPHS
jgi:hypothetical protein